jgi:SAM-dependent methyltransferase
MSSASAKISAATVRADFNDPVAVVHYARAAHFLGLWESERILIERFFPDKTAPLLEAGCGAGRATLGLWHLGYRNLTAFDFAEELLDQARQLATDQGVTAIRFLHADATQLTQGCHPLDDVPAHPPASGNNGNAPIRCHLIDDKRLSATPPPSLFQPSQFGSQPTRSASSFAGALFLFNGLMQIPGRDHRRAALRELHAVCRPGAPLLFTTHDRDVSPTERALWRLEKLRWENATQDPRLVDFGDRYFEDETGRTFMHLPDRTEILEDLAATCWTHTFDSLRRDIAKESRAVRDFSDECRFWSATRA